MSRAPLRKGRQSLTSARLAMTLLGPWLGSLIVPGRVLAAHHGPSPGERDIAIAEVILVALLLGGVLLAILLSKRFRPKLRRRRSRLK